MAFANVNLTPQLVQAVRDAVDIVDVASDLTTLKQRGNKWKGLCPFHKEKTPSFSVDAAQGLYYCFGCGAGGDAIKLHMQASGDDFPAAVETLARRYGIPLPAVAARGRERDGVDPLAVLESAAGWFVAQLGKHAVPRRYLEERRIPAELAERYRLGYAPDAWRQLLGELGAKHAAADLERAGLVGRSERGETYDRFRHRLMFPIATASGRVVGFGGRTLGDDRAKYVNTPETEWFHKGQLLYGLSQAKKALRDDGRALLVEGYFDVLGAAAAGIEGVVAGMGTALTVEQARLLARYCDEVVVAYDGDDAGESAFRRALPILLREGLAVRRTRFPDGHDPDSLRLAAGNGAVVEAVDAAEDAVRAEIDRLTAPEDAADPHRRTAAASAVATLLQPVRDGIVRYGYGQRAAERLALPLELLWKRVAETPRERTAAGDGDAAAAATGEGRRGRDVRSEEERVLAVLLHGAAPPPPPEDLPPPEVFLDPEARNIYAAYRDLYSSHGRAPAGRDVVSRLSGEGRILDRAARLLVEEPLLGEEDAGSESLGASLQRLRHRWRQQRRRELDREIRDAQSRGDQPVVERLLEEQKALIRSLHPDMTGNLW